MKTLFLTEAEVKSLLTMEETLDAVEQAFHEKGSGEAQMPCKQYLFYKKYNGDVRVMPAYLTRLDISGVKVVNVHPDNAVAGTLPTVMATILLVSPQTGQPLGIFDGTWITTIRTGAAAGVATKYLARANAARLGLVGAGAQAETQLDAVARVRTLSAVRIVDKNRRVAEEFARKMASHVGVPITVVDSIEACVKESDILCTQTPVRTPIVRKEWVAPGTHINAMGADAPGKQELDPELLKEARIVIDDWEQASHSGEINVPLARRVIVQDDIYAEIGDIVVGRRPARTSDQDITIFDSTGLALQDLVTAWRVYQVALKQNRGTWLEYF